MAQANPPLQVFLSYLDVIKGSSQHCSAWNLRKGISIHPSVWLQWSENSALKKNVFAISDASLWPLLRFFFFCILHYMMVMRLLDGNIWYAGAKLTQGLSSHHLQPCWQTKMKLDQSEKPQPMFYSNLFFSFSKCSVSSKSACQAHCGYD